MKREKKRKDGEKAWHWRPKLGLRLGRFAIIPTFIGVLMMMQVMTVEQGEEFAILGIAIVATSFFLFALVCLVGALYLRS
ncbi:hypothetical protein CV102_17590 [Natronococcus pandeyae]|uniref:Uncharacterized protein n=2 Tax=Natronococcus pandeyae TaxID=2055836 RepID=A0A8J8Q1U2_9EURY|nr:hypothetical protein CV102_17590 [Natronococcus pandeyae]